MKLDAKNLDYKALNEIIKATTEDLVIENCLGQRYIGAGLSDKQVSIHGTPGNALGAYLDGATLTVYGNVQDAVGDTMNDGKIIVHGNAGDALGYAMRGGKIFVRGNAGYRTGIHMKQYKEKKPVVVVGGKVGSFLGEYLAGGLMIVLGLDDDSASVPVGNFTGTGMHGGSIYIRTNQALQNLPAQVTVEMATPEDLEEIKPALAEFAACFQMDIEPLLAETFYKLSPNAKNPYKQLYTAN